MKKLIFILTVAFTMTVAHGQTTHILVGETTPGFYYATYSPIYKIQDTVYDQAPNTTSHVIPIDLDGDNINDLSIYSSYYSSFADDLFPFEYPVWWSGLLLDSLTDVIIINSSFNTVDTLNYGDTINKFSNWFNGNVRFCSNINNYTVDSTWKEKNDYYVGLRLRKTNDTLYGWLKVSVQDYHIVYLEKHACQSLNPKDTIINLLTSIDENMSHTLGHLQIFPNPFSTQTTLQSNFPLTNATLTVYNSCGQTVKQIKNISGQTVTFSRDNLASGLYFVRLTEGNKIFTDKLIITDR
ncbi:MAG TPA: T9SS type A sorting domain-containing protein [Bacteroidales bacterium]|nr:T9SS type A sorting domain-containing protein [Bacteroidales bacterium]